MGGKTLTAEPSKEETDHYKVGEAKTFHPQIKLSELTPGQDRK